MKKIQTLNSSICKKTINSKIKNKKIAHSIPQIKKLEQTPKADSYCDYSTEDMGFFTKRDKNGKILNIFRIIYPR